MSNSPTAFTIQKVKRTNKRLFVGWHNGVEDRTVNSTDNALPAFEKALNALAPLVATICHLPPEYTALNLRVVGVVMGEQSGVDTVSIVAQKSLDDAGKAFAIVTPPRLMQLPTEEGSYTPPLSDKDADLVQDLIEAAKDYAKGNRAQGELPGLNGDEDDPDMVEGEASAESGAELPFPTGAADEAEKPVEGNKGQPAKKKKRRSSKK